MRRILAILTTVLLLCAGYWALARHSPFDSSLPFARGHAGAGFDEEITDLRMAVPEPGDRHRYSVSLSDWLHIKSRLSEAGFERVQQDRQSEVYVISAQRWPYRHEKRLTAQYLPNGRPWIAIDVVALTHDW